MTGTTIIIGNSGTGTSMALAPGESVSVTATETAPTSACGLQTVNTHVKQSNDFNGTGNDFTNTASDPQLTVTGALDHFTLATVPDQVAGVGFTVTATAWDTCGAKMTGYAGGASLTGTLSGIGGAVPSYGSFAAGSFQNANGSAQSSNTVAVKAETSRTLTATAAGQAGTSLPSNQFNVSAGVPYAASFMQQPSDAQTNTQQTVTIQVTDQYGNPAGGYPVSLGITPGTGDPTATLSGGSSTTDPSGLAVFSVSIDKPGGPAVGTLKYTLDAKYNGTKLQTQTSATSAAFSVDLFLVPCNPAASSCVLPQQNLGSQQGNIPTTFDATATGTGLGGIAGDSFTFPTDGNGNPVIPAGCANFRSVGAAGVVLDVRPFTNGVIDLDYGVPLKLIKQNGPNNGNPFIPHCAGIARVDSAGTVIPCNTDPNPAPMGRQLDSTGAFTGNLIPAVCDSTGTNPTHKWWLILPSFQDKCSATKTTNCINPATNPFVKSWATDPTGTYRVFTIELNWPDDYKGMS